LIFRLAATLLACGLGLPASQSHAEDAPAVAGAETVSAPAPAPPSLSQPPLGPPPPPTPAATPPSGGFLQRWLNPKTSPFIPIPEIGVDPNSGTTLGVIPTWIRTDDDDNINRIIAPDVLHNPYFGYGAHARLYSFDSTDEQWSVVAGIKERVERGVDGEYEVGRLRNDRWSVKYSLVFDRSGTPRFYGVGNESPAIDETNYTNTTDLAQAVIGYNLNHKWQLQYTTHLRVVDVTPGTLAKIATIESRFGRILGVGTNKEFLNRLAAVYDTRDDITIPHRGMLWEAYAGLSSRHGLFNNSLYSETGVDGRMFWSLDEFTTVASHISLRYQLASHAVPFWALSSIGGDQSDLGGSQPLRGFGLGRFYDHDAFSSSVELRRQVASFNAAATTVNLEITPFVDLGRVFAHSDTVPFTELHQVYGVGFRGVARPSVVGYVDIGHGSEGLAVFTGLNYPF
jgi:hypothetical protein